MVGNIIGIFATEYTSPHSWIVGSLCVEINECAHIKPTRLIPSPAEDQWLVVEKCNQEVINCKSNAMQTLLVIRMCVDPPVVTSDVPASTHSPGKSITLCENDNKDDDDDDCDDDDYNNNNYYYYWDGNDGDDDDDDDYNNNNYYYCDGNDGDDDDDYNNNYYYYYCDGNDDDDYNNNYYYYYCDGNDGDDDDYNNNYYYCDGNDGHDDDNDAQMEILTN